MTNRNNQVTRILRTLGVLEGAPHGLTVSELHSRMVDRGFDENEKTTRRDLDALRAVFPIEEKGRDDSGATRWVLDPSMRVGDYLTLQYRELIALYLAKGALEPLRETPFYEDLTELFSKINDRIGPKGREFMKELEKEYAFHPGPVWGLGLQPGVADTCRKAVEERQMLRCTYDSVSSGSRTSRHLGPHYLFFSKGALYLLARDTEDNKLKSFALTRMQDARMLDEPFDEKPVDPAERFAGAFGVYHGDGKTEKVCLEFTYPTAHYITERRWHSSQSIVQKEKSLELHMEVTITPELVKWVAGFGDDITIIGPGSLREKVKEHAQRILSGLKGAS